MRVKRVNMDEKGRKFVSVPCNYLKIKLCGRCFDGRGVGGENGAESLIYVSFKYDIHIKRTTVGLVLSPKFMKS